MPGVSKEQIAQPHLARRLGRVRRQLVGEDVGDFFVGAQQSLICGDADGDRGEGFRERIKLRPLVEGVGRQRQLRSDLSVFAVGKRVDVHAALVRAPDKGRQ